jgi:inorganic pyrophosphatase
MSEDEDDLIKVMVEIPKGGRNKYEYNQETGEIELDRRVFAAVSFPTDYGFVKETQAHDGDELDAVVAVTEATFPGCVIPARPIAVLKMYEEDGTPDPKILAVPVSDPAWSSLEGADDLPGDLSDEIIHFFHVYSDLEGDDPEIEGWGTREEAQEVIEAARRRLREDDG